MEDLNPGDLGRRNLEKLKSPNTVAVLTGQQAGIFGGPCFAAYKAATAVQVSVQLESKGYSAVPIFWVASDDSDFEEIRSSQLVDRNGFLTAIRHPDEREHPRQMAGTIPVNPSTTLEYLEALRGLSDQPQVVEMIQASYGSGKTFRQGFASWLADLFGEYGLLLFDPLSEEYRKHLPEFLSICIDSREELVSAVHRRNEALSQAGLPVQVQIDDSETFLFLVDRPKRFKLVFRNGFYEAKGRKSFRLGKEDLRRQIDNGEITIGVNVLLRPILQEWLFPTFGSVLGPAEVAYMAQANSVSSFWEQKVAAIPRAAFTIVDRKAQRLLRKYDLEAAQVMKLSRSELAVMVLREGEGAEILADFESLRKDLSDRLGELKGRIAAEDPTVSALLEGSSRKIHYQIDKVVRRFALNHQSQEGFRGEHLTYLRSLLFPGNQLQERALGFNTFLAQEGSNLVRMIVSRADPRKNTHQLLYL
jgi:bacillithiol biosynthesis cysteine-adding enzyme BshC